MSKNLLNITPIKHKSSKNNSPISNKDYHNFHPPTPPTSCGPPTTIENEFLQFYQQLYKSAVLFSDVNFQQMLLFPQGGGNYNNYGIMTDNPSSPTMKRSVKKAKRRLSSVTTISGNADDVKSCSSSSSYNSAESGSLTKTTFSQHFLISSNNVTSTPTKVDKDKVNKPKPPPGLKRRVSFSKNSPRARSRSNSNSQQQQQLITDGGIPWITIQEQDPDSYRDIQDLWSSDMDESDTTETDTDTDDENANSTVGEGDGSHCYVYEANVNVREGDFGDGDNEHSTDDGKKEIKKKPEMESEEVELKLKKFNELSTKNEHDDET